MILIDTSAWVEHLRDADQRTADAVEALLGSGAARVTEPVVMEVLAGARTEAQSRRLRSLLARADLERCESQDFVEAAFLYRLCRANGETIRSQIDCLIAAVAIRTGLAVLHHDRDFEALARHTPLQSAS